MSSLAKQIRLGDGLSLNAGTVGFHLDHLNDPRFLYDQITWGLIQVDSWYTYLSEKSLDLLKTNNVSETNSAFTALFYGRSIVGSQADKLAGIADESNPLFQTCVGLINDEIFPFDYGTLQVLESRRRMMSSIAAAKVDGRVSGSDYKGWYAQFPEGNNRFVFLGSFAFVWFLFVEKHKGKVQYRHRFEFVAFLMVECNGSLLVVETMLKLLDNEYNTLVESTLALPVPALYALLSREVQRAKPGKAVISSTANRWQKVDRPLWTGPHGDSKTKFFVEFVQSQLCQLNLCSDLESAKENCSFLCSNSSRKTSNIWDERELDIIKLGPVRGTFGIQISAYLLLTPGYFANYASVEGGTSGYFKCVNSHLNGNYEGEKLTTEEAEREVSECIRSLKNRGFAVNDAWMDQNCCYHHRRYGRDDGRDGRKNDIFFIDRNDKLFTPFRSKDFQCGRTDIQFFVNDKWYAMSDLWVPAHEVNNPNSRIGLRRELGNEKYLKRWVQELGSAGTMESMRLRLCRNEDGTQNLF
jgi:hypothetical protein